MGGPGGAELETGANGDGTLPLATCALLSSTLLQKWTPSPTSIKYFKHTHISLYFETENRFIFLTGIKFTVLEVSFA